MSNEAKAIIAVAALLLVLLVHEMAYQDAARAEFVRHYGEQNE